MVEILLSLSIWMVMTVSLIPLYIHVSKQSMNIQQEVQSTHLLYEVLQKYLIAGEAENKSETREKYVFAVAWEIGLDGYPTKVCVNYEDTFHKAKQICEKIE